MTALRDDLTVLIPAAGRVPEGLLALSNIVCPAMIPVGGRPVIHWTLSYLRSLGVRHFVIAVARRGMFVEDFVDAAFGQDCEIEFIVPDATATDAGVGRTVLALAERVTTKRALVVLGDTHFQLADPAVLDGGPFVLTHPVEDSYRWCIAESDTDGMIRALHDKVEGLAAPLDALIGVYGFPDAERLRTVAREAVAAAATAGKRTELAAILEGVQARTPIRAIRAGSWLDCGNADMQARSHQALLQARAFNELSIDPTLGTITKRSREREKFIDEINYLRLLPPELAVLFPRLIAYSTEWADPWMTMEYYGYPSLSEVFLFENVDPGVWERVFGHLHDVVVGAFGKKLRPLPDGALVGMLIGKTRRRLASMRATPALLAFLAHEGEVTVNGKRMANLPMLWPRLEAEAERLAEGAVGTVVHGDLCLSNILYDLRSRIVKLIDPRGSFGGAGIFGDPRYDVAKLWHSVHGRYDFIVNDLFRAKLDGATLTVDVRASAAHREIEDRFARVFFVDAASLAPIARGGDTSRGQSPPRRPLGDDPARFSRRDVTLLAGFLFASMPALHYDRPDRQLAMVARALELFDEALAMPVSPASTSTPGQR